MIVLDEQLLGRGLETEIGRWYRGTVCLITDIKPASVIKDDGMPVLLHQQSQPTFVNINEIDFWRKVEISPHFCVICFTLLDAHATELPGRLRKVTHHPLFTTKRQRMGKVIRVSEQGSTTILLRIVQSRKSLFEVTLPDSCRFCRPCLVERPLSLRHQPPNAASPTPRSAHWRDLGKTSCDFRSSTAVPSVTLPGGLACIMSRRTLSARMGFSLVRFKQ